MASAAVAALVAGAMAVGCGSGSSVPRGDAGGTGGRDGGADRGNVPPGCDNVGCGAPPLCSVGCQERCGCCPCTESLVEGAPGAQLRCSGGCWVPFISPLPVQDGGAGDGGADAGRDAPIAPPDGPAGDAPGPTLTGDGPLPASGAVDIVFLVDDSSSMRPAQLRMAQAFPAFIDALKALPGGQPSLRVAIISSSLGAGLYDNIAHCEPGGDGNRNGAFQHDPSCTALHPGERFIVSDRGAVNFDGDISALFGCMAALGDMGCGFEHQFESTRLALERARDPADPDNGGFLRDDAALAIVMLTNEDDCSAPPDSTLFDPTQQRLSDPLGGFYSYRCNEFGHLCGGQPPPHTVPDGQMVTLTGCVPAEDKGRLTKVADFVSFLKGLKPDPRKIFVAALAGPPEPYVVTTHTAIFGTTSEVQPMIAHSCSTASDSSYADPVVRIRAWIDAFGANGVLENICADDLSGPMARIGAALGAAIRP